MNRFLSVILLALACSGCSYHEMEFRDADGTTFKSKAVLAPFGTIKGADTGMAYAWTEKDGKIAVGAKADSVDHSGQVEGIAALGAAVGAGVAAGIKGVK